MSSLHSYPSGGLFSPKDVPSLKLRPALIPNRHRGNCSNMPGLRVGRGVASWRITLTSLEVKDFLMKKILRYIQSRNKHTQKTLMMAFSTHLVELVDWVDG